MIFLQSQKLVHRDLRAVESKAILNYIMMHNLCILSILFHPMKKYLPQTKIGKYPYSGQYCKN